jgi:hypothetical protein
MPREGISRAEGKEWAKFVEMARRDLRIAIPPYGSDGHCFMLRPEDRSYVVVDLEAFVRGLANYLARSDVSLAHEFDVKEIFKLA